jgi:hypothetical protein
MGGWLIRTGCGKLSYLAGGDHASCVETRSGWSTFRLRARMHGAPPGARQNGSAQNAGSIHDCVARRVETARISLECTPGSRYRSKGAARRKKAREDLSFPGFPFLGSLPVGRPLHDIERPPMTGTSTHGPRPPAQGRDVGWLSGGAPPVGHSRRPPQWGAQRGER